MVEEIQSAKNNSVKNRAYASNSGYIAPWWARNKHLQTVWGSVFRHMPELPTMKRHRLELDDSDFIDVDIHYQNNRPTLLLLHGLEGSIHSPYIRGMIHSAVRKNWQIAVMHFRSCSGEPNRLLKSYNSGVSDDLDEVIEKLKLLSINIDFIVGYSLGGNVLLKWLGEQKNKVTIKAAAAVSVPMMLDICALEINRGFSKIYEYALLRTLRKKTRAKLQKFPNQSFLQSKQVSKLTSFVKFDDQLTAPVHGYKNGQDYYSKASSRQFVKDIKIPTLIIQAKDDPFMNDTVIPDLSELPTNVILELNANGGHVGFVQGRWPWVAEYYLESRIPNYLASFLPTRR